MATGYVRVRFEDVPGYEGNTATPSTKATFLPVLNLQPDPGSAPLERDDELRGVDQPLQVIEEGHAPTLGFETRNYPDTLGTVLTAMLGAPTTTAGDGVITDPDSNTIPVGAHRHVWTAPFKTGLVPQTSLYDLAYEDQGVYFTMHGHAIDSLQIATPETGGSALTVSGPGLYMPRGSDPSLTPVYESLSIPPFTRRGLTAPTWLSGSADLEDISLTITNPVEASKTMGSSTKWLNEMEKADGPVVVSASVVTRSVDASDYDAMLATTGFAAKLLWENDAIIASSYPYRFWSEFSNAQYIGGQPGALANQRRIGATFDLKATYAGSAAATLTLVNATSSYA